MSSHRRRRRPGRAKPWFWQRGSGIRLRLWMAFHLAVLLVLTYGVGNLLRSQESDPPFQRLGATNRAPVAERLILPPAAPEVPGKERFLDADGTHFGISTEEAPYSAAETDAVAAAAGRRPTMIEYFAKFDEEFRPDAVRSAYEQGVLPVLSWEPWVGGEEFTDEPEYSLRSIADGRHDPYIRQFARDVAEQGWPIALRFAQEMNGIWFPWSEQNSGNRKGDFTDAWKHLRKVFDDEGADNVIWVWSPNIVRPVPKTSLKQLYPGDAYVDWIGLTGYSVEESTPEQVFGPTLDRLRKFTDKPLLITETGVSPSSRKPGWIKQFFPWMERQDDMIGFIWFQMDSTGKGRADWRFDSDPESRRLFRQGLADTRLVEEDRGIG